MPGEWQVVQSSKGKVRSRGGSQNNVDKASSQANGTAENHANDVLARLDADWSKTGAATKASSGFASLEVSTHFHMSMH